MIEAELLIGHLRSQVRNLQSLLHYLEGREAVEEEDYTYSTYRLQEMIGHLKELERFSSQRCGRCVLRANWLN